MKVSVISGPSHHGPAVIAALQKAGMLGRAVLQYPAFQVIDGGGEVVRQAPLFDLGQRATWALWRRLPGLGSRETPRGALFSLYARLASQQLAPCDLLIGWQQVSLHAFRRARSWGAVTVLEHPMTHIDAFSASLEEEVSAWDRGTGVYSDFPWLNRRRSRRECDEADWITVLSSYARRTFVERGVHPRKLIELPLGVDTDRFTPPERPREPGPYRVLCVGRVELLKGVPYLLQALRRLPHPDIELSLVGPVFPEMRPILDELSDPRLRLVPAQSPEALARRYQQADLLVFPTVNDALGLVLLEAMASGLPVVATERSGAPDIVREGVDGFVVPARSPEALADRIAWMADHPDQGRQMGRAARERVMARYTLEAHAERLLALCQRLVNERRA